MVSVIKWLCLVIGVVYTIDNLRNRILGYGVDFSRKFIVISGILGFIICNFI